MFHYLLIEVGVTGLGLIAVIVTVFDAVQLFKSVTVTV